MLHQFSKLVGTSSARHRTVTRNLVLRPAMLGLAVAAAFSAQPLAGQTLPNGGVAIHGQAIVSTTTPRQLVVTTQNGAGTAHSAINWQSFSIAAGNSARIHQPSAASLSINRVMTNTPSAIFGNLSSNGRLVLVNPSGITVGAGAVIDTAGFTASALRMTDADALTGRLRFGDAAPGMGGAAGITVEGRITARDGDVVLVAPQIAVGSSALLQAPNGSTILAAGQQVEITGRGLEGIALLVQARDNEARNLGRLEGDAVGIFAGTLRHSGEIQATTATLDGGRVVLRALHRLELDGAVRAQASNGQGGQVHATAQSVHLLSGALLDASGNNGGEVLVGGGWRGSDARVSNAQDTMVDSGARLSADATGLGSGNGGTVVVWADNHTGFAGAISARGGASGGDAGRAEVSGKHTLDFQGQVDLRAAQGLTGTLLLDPLIIRIGNTADVNGDAATGDDVTGDIASGDFPGATSRITAAQVSTLLNSTSLSLMATSDIFVDNAVTKASGSFQTLTLDAGGSVALNASISGSAGSPLGVTLISRSGSGGIFTQAATAISTFGGSVNMTTANGASLDGSINAAAGDVTISGLGTVAMPTAAITASTLTLANTGGGATFNGANNVAAARLSATSGNVMFNNAAPSFLLGGTGGSSLTITGTGQVTVDQAVNYGNGIGITANAGINLAADLVSGSSLGLNTVNSLINQTAGQVGAVGLAVINAGTNDISLFSATNDFSSVNLTGGNLSVVDANALTVTSRSQVANTNLYLQAIAGLLTVPGGAINTGTAQLSLISGAGAFTTPGALNGSALLLVGGTSLTLAHNVTASGNMTLFSSGALTQTAGTVASSIGNMDVTATGTLTVQGGAGSPTAMLATGNQTISVANIQLLGGAGSSNASASIRMQGTSATQSITASNNITLTGGASGGGVGAGNFAMITSDGNQIINASSIDLNGGAGGIENLAQIRQGNTTTGLGATQLISIGGSGGIGLVGGAGTTNLARIQAFGLSQTIGFAAGGNLSLTGGAGASENFARIQSVNGNMSISGAPDISLNGGASGGADLKGNFADIRAMAASATQFIAAGDITLQAGTTGQENFATIVAQTQTITALGDVSLTGGGSATSLDGTSGGGARIGGLGGAAPGPTNLTLNVGGSVSVSGGTVAGSALGSNAMSGQATTITIVAGGDVSINPGSGLGSGARIGSAAANIAAGNINITAAADFSLAGGTAGETAVRTLGAVNINAATASIGNRIIGGTVRLQASSGVSINTSSGEAGSISASAGSGDTLKVDAGTSFFNNSGSGALNVAAGGRWRVFSTDPSLDTRGGLIYDFKQYNVAFGGTVLGTGNGFLYSLAPTLTALLSGAIVKPYDGTNTASIAPANLSVAGALMGDIVSVSGPSTGTYDTRHVGVGKAVNLNPGAITVSALDGSAPVFGYAVAGGPVTGVMGQITPAGLTVSTSAVSKSYDGTTGALGTPIATSGNLYGSDNLVGGTFSFLDRNVGTNKTVSVAAVSVNDGNGGANYSLSYANNPTSSITALAAAIWTGSADTAWTNPANWAGGVVPDLTNVQTVTIPAGAGSVVFDAAAGTTSLQTLTSARPINITGGNLQIDSLLQTGSYSQSGTSSLSGTGSLVVTDSFSQSGGTIAMGAINIHQTTGNLSVGNLSAPVMALSAPTGMITQTGSLTGGGVLVTASKTGTLLPSTGNQVGALSATNAGSGDVVFANTGTLSIQSVANVGGNIDVVNTGGVITSGAISAPAGNVHITANSPLTIGAGGIAAGGDIVLDATNLTSAGDLTLNGFLSAGNIVSLTAGNAMVQNSAVFGANGVTANAGTSMLYGPFAITNNPPVTYSVGGVTVTPPPTVLASSLQAPGDILVTFLDLFQQAINGDLGDLLELDADGNLRRKFVDGLVSEEELCR